jgi:preprotein translocase subunit SecA
MSLFSQWKAMTEAQMSPQEHQAFWNEYFDIETQAYKKILERKENFYEDKLTAIAEEFGMSPVVFSGFMDGINTSLAEEVDLDSLKEDSDVSLKVDFEKLYYNMLEAKAKWLSSLSGWDGIFSEEKRREIKDKWRQDRQAVSTKIGRNEPCPCGSGKKYKKCCGKDVTE